MNENRNKHNRSPRARFTRAQGLTIINGVLIFVVVITILQLWLLTATVNAYQGGDTGIAIPAAIVSAACLGLNIGLLRYLHRLG